MSSTLHVIGSNSFIAKNFVKIMGDDYSLNLISRNEVDLTHPSSVHYLRRSINPNDDILLFAAKAPCRDSQDFHANISMANNLVLALSGVPVNFFGYVSSDAIYEDSTQRIRENFPTTSKSLHGLMHLTRELIFQTEINHHAFLCVRPTSIYGKNDPHNGYGPNRFIRQLQTQDRIEIFGNGEELRDHISVDDVAELIRRLYIGKHIGVFNLCTGNVVTFGDLARETLRLSPTAQVISLARSGPPPHDGYRALDNSSILMAFPGYKFTNFRQYISTMIAEMGHVNE